MILNIDLKKIKNKKTTIIFNPCFSSHFIHNQNGGPHGFFQFYFKKVHGLLKKRLYFEYYNFSQSVILTRVTKERLCKFRALASAL